MRLCSTCFPSRWQCYFCCSCLSASIFSLSSYTENSDIDLEDGNKKKKNKLWCFSDTSRRTSTNCSLAHPLLNWTLFCDPLWNEHRSAFPPDPVLRLCCLSPQQPCVFMLRLVIDPSWSLARINAPQVNLNFRAARPAPPASLDWLHWCEHYNCRVTVHGV